MKNRIKKAGCLLLAALLLTGTVSCAPHKPTNTGERLVVQEQTVTYTTAFVEEIVPVFTDVICRLMRLFGAPLLQAEERQAVQESVRRDLIPSALRAELTEQELRRVVAAADTYCLEATSATTDGERLQAFCRFYQDLIATVGTVRAGILGFDGTKLYLTGRITLCEKRYQEYGYDWYLSDADAYRAKLKNLETQLTERSFTDAMGVLAFLGSFFTGAAPTEWTGTEGLIYDSELFAILQAQADHFATLELTSEQWHVLFDLYSEIEPKSTDTPFKVVLGAWQRAGTSAKIAESMPELLALYRSFTAASGPEALALLRAECTREESITAICRGLAPCRAELLTFLARLEPLIETEGVAEEEGLRRLGHLEAYNAFLQTTKAKTKEQLYEAIAACAATDGGNAAAVEEALLGYLRGISPALAYALSTNRKGVS